MASVGVQAGLAVTYGPLPVLADLLAGTAGVSAAFIYGSWAAANP